MGIYLASTVMSFRMHKERTISAPEPEAPFYFTVAELAEYSRIGVNTLYRTLRKRGDV